MWKTGENYTIIDPNGKVYHPGEYVEARGSRFVVSKDVVELTDDEFFYQDWNGKMANERIVAVLNIHDGEDGKDAPKLKAIAVNQPTETTATITETLTDDSSITSNTFNLPKGKDGTNGINAPKLKSIQVSSNPETATATITETLTDDSSITSNEFELARGKEGEQGRAGKEISNIEVSSENKGATTDVGMTFEFNDGSAISDKHFEVQNGVVENLATINGQPLTGGGNLELQKPIELVPNEASGDTNADLTEGYKLRIWDSQFEGADLVKNYRIAKSEIAGMSDLDTDLPTTKTINKFMASKTELTNGLSTKANQTDLTALTSKVNSKADQSAVDTINTKLTTKQDKLVAGDNITISGNTISATSGKELWEQDGTWMNMKTATTLYMTSKRIQGLADGTTSTDAVNKSQLDLKADLTAIANINDELNTKQNKTDNSLTTTSKDVVGAINEINAKPTSQGDFKRIDKSITMTGSGKSVSFSGVSQGVFELNLTIELASGNTASVSLFAEASSYTNNSGRILGSMTSSDSGQVQSMTISYSLSGTTLILNAGGDIAKIRSIDNSRQVFEELPKSRAQMLEIIKTAKPEKIILN